MLRLSWALTVLGARQAAYLFDRPRNANELERPARPLVTSPVDAVLNGMEEQFDGVFRALYRLGREYLPGVGEARP